MMKFKTTHLNELSLSENKATNGGTFNYFAYAMGYIVGTAVATVQGAYASGYDAAEDNCECD
jgi:hypothetical protein